MQKRLRRNPDARGRRRGRGSATSALDVAHQLQLEDHQDLLRAEGGPGAGHVLPAGSARDRDHSGCDRDRGGAGRLGAVRVRIDTALAE